MSPCNPPGAVKFRWHTNGNALGLSISISYVFPISPNHVRLQTVRAPCVNGTFTLNLIIHVSSSQNGNEKSKARDENTAMKRKIERKEKSKKVKIKWIFFCVCVSNGMESYYTYSAGVLISLTAWHKQINRTGFICKCEKKQDEE